jgi:hypothetical protein
MIRIKKVAFQEISSIDPLFPTSTQMPPKGICSDVTLPYGFLVAWRGPFTGKSAE